MVHLTDIAYELLERVFLLTDIQSLGRLQQVSKLCLEVIQSSVRIRYKLELALEGLEDGPPGGLSPAERLEALLGRKGPWRATRSSRIDPLSKKVHAWTYGANFLSWIDTDGIIFFVELPSDVKKISAKSWAVQGLPFHLACKESLKIDPFQNLFVVASILPDPQWQLSVQIRQMTTGDFHPECGRLFSLALVETCQEEPVIHIGGDYLAIQYHAEPTLQRFTMVMVVMNWKTGAFLLYLIGQSLACAFLTEDHILIGHDEPNCHTLSVFDLRTCHGKGYYEQVAELKDQAICQLLYPEKDQNCGEYRVDMESGTPPPRSDHTNVTHLPFRTGWDRLILVRSFEPVEVVGEDAGHCASWVSTAAVMQCVRKVEHGEKDSKTFEWEEWGPEGSLMMCLGHRTSAYGCSTAFLYPFETDRRIDTMIVYSFQQRALRKALQSQSESEVYTHPKILGSNMFFASAEIETRLKGRMDVWNITKDLVGFDAKQVQFVLNEDTLVWVHPPRSADGQYLFELSIL
ncbi:hypothetical protein BXZ70DRAFT_2976 [Cristinia sonorae]|uniref:F-box domain-containing protein n=1 Tax=Cristinia sonorae TaxID=1940300 RepID=A0A8K0V0Y5_9AGAR|nr:hypothetical protein BXZ70DRAFT_2976 [Cristinia sonorae]